MWVIRVLFFFFLWCFVNFSYFSSLLSLSLSTLHPSSLSFSFLSPFHPPSLPVFCPLCLFFSFSLPPSFLVSIYSSSSDPWRSYADFSSSNITFCHPHHHCSSREGGVWSGRPQWHPLTHSLRPRNPCFSRSSVQHLGGSVSLQTLHKIPLDLQCPTWKTNRIYHCPSFM